MPPFEDGGTRARQTKSTAPNTPVGVSTLSQKISSYRRVFLFSFSLFFFPPPDLSLIILHFLVSSSVTVCSTLLAFSFAEDRWFKMTGSVITWRTFPGRRYCPSWSPGPPLFPGKRRRLFPPETSVVHSLSDQREGCVHLWQLRLLSLPLSSLQDLQTPLSQELCPKYGSLFLLISHPKYQEMLAFI